MLASYSENRQADPSVPEDCFVKTMQLDGETNLKPKLPMKPIHDLFKAKCMDYQQRLDAVSKIEFTVSPPETDLYSFKASVTFPDGQTKEVDLKQFLHRGAKVANSNMIDAVVVFTGRETKLVMNQGNYHFKVSQLDKAINWITLWNMIIIFVMATIMTVGSYNFISEYEQPDGPGTGAYYIFYNSPGDLALKAFGSYYLLFNQFIPFELIIILEMVKIWYTSFIEKDVQLINVETASSVKVQNLSMHEEMGQI